MVRISGGRDEKLGGTGGGISAEGVGLLGESSLRRLVMMGVVDGSLVGRRDVRDMES